MNEFMRNALSGYKNVGVLVLMVKDWDLQYTIAVVCFSDTVENAQLALEKLARTVTP